MSHLCVLQRKANGELSCVYSRAKTALPSHKSVLQREANGGSVMCHIKGLKETKQEKKKAGYKIGQK